MFCVHCGKEIPNDATFCVYCGKKVFQKDENEVVSTGEDKDANMGKNTSFASSVEGLCEAFSAGKELLNVEAGQRNDTICPFCKLQNCQPLQKSTTEVKHRGYGWGSGCCGLLLLGPFGLLCGMCGMGSEVKTTSELWWVCQSCGKQHISLESALKKWDATIAKMPGGGVAIGILFLIFKWLDLGLISFFVEAVSLLGPAVGLYSIHQEISEELGETLILYLSPEQKKRSVVMLLLSTALILLVGLFAVPLLNSLLGE